MDDNAKAQERLKSLWLEAIADLELTPDPRIEQLILSDSVSIRFATITQILGKLTDRRRNILCLQKGGPGQHEGSVRWDPRSFCSKVVVPWVQETEGMRSVIGSSTDPYVSKPLRRPWLHEGLEHVRNASDWELLIELLEEIEENDNPTTIAEQTLRQCLLCVARQLASTSISYPVPVRASQEQVGIALEEFVSAAQGGEGLLIATTAIVRVLSEELSIYSQVKRQGITESDSASGVPGDILCYQTDVAGKEELCLVIEVKDRDLTITELDATIHKAREKRLTELIFVTPAVKKSDAEAIKKRIAHEWAQGINVYQISLHELAKPILMLLGEEGRSKLLQIIGEEIDNKSTGISLRSQWSEILRSIGGQNEGLDT